MKWSLNDFYYLFGENILYYIYIFISVLILKEKMYHSVRNTNTILITNILRQKTKCIDTFM